MKNKTIMLLFLILFHSCNCVETNLTKEEKEWFSAYKKGEVFTFKGNQGSLDTIVVTEKLEFHGNKNCNWVEIGSIQNHIMSIHFKSKNCFNEPYCGGEITISKYKADKKSFPSISVFGLFFSEKFKQKELKRSVKLITNNKGYPFAYYFEDKINANGFGTNCIKSFYWDKKEGLIKYEKRNGEIFEFLKKIK